MTAAFAATMDVLRNSTNAWTGFNCRMKCTDAHEIMRTMPNDCVDVTICDPPYTEHVQNNLRNSWVERKDGLIVKSKGVKKIECGFAPLESRQFVLELLRVTKRWVLVFSDIESLGDYKRVAPREFVRSWIWRKQQAAPQLSGDRPANSCEGIAIFHRAGRKRWNGRGRHAFCQHPRERGPRLHPTQKPQTLMVELVDLFSEPDEVIFDPFAGSGSTGVAALTRGRRFYGIEQNEVHYETACQRLTAARKAAA